LDAAQEPAVGARCCYLRAGVRPQRPLGPAFRQLTCARLLQGRVRHAWPAAEPRPFTFLDERARDFHADWGNAADVVVSILRTEAGRDPHDKELHDLVGELNTRSLELRRRWSSHNVRHHGAGLRTFRHPIVGEMNIAYEGLEMAAEPGLTLTIYSTEPGLPSEPAMRLLASWAATEYAQQAGQQLGNQPAG
jgi:hypothetical protein